jgi:predicted phosphodiesterase
VKQYRPRLTEDENKLLSNFRNGKNVGVIGDTHLPYCIKETKDHVSYLQFCEDTFNRFGCSEIVHIGDECDNAALSMHQSETGMPDVVSEAEQAQKELNEWYRVFPDVKVCVGNHSALPFRQATIVGIPKSFLKTYEEIWNAPKGWKWELQWEIDGVLYEHGTGSSGVNGARNRAIANRQSTVVGHSHSFGGVSYMANRNDLIFGLNVGCGISVSHMAFAYGKHFPLKPTIGCGVVLDSGRTGIFIPMDLGSKLTRI